MVFTSIRLKYYSSFLGLAILVLLGYSCNPNNPDGSKLNVFKYNQANNISSLDPAFAKSQNNMWAVNQIFDGLVYVDDSLKIVPRLAKFWSTAEDGKEIDFTLDQSFSFHDDPCFPDGKGRHVTAEDVVYSFQRIISDELNSPGSWIFSGLLEDENPFVALSDSVFRIRLKKAFYPIMGILTMQYCSIVAKEAVEYYGSEFRSHPVGTGPFKFKRWQENHALYLSKNSNYPYIQHNLDGIKISFIPDKKIAFFEFLNGRLDFFSGIESSFSKEILDATGELRTDRAEEINMHSQAYLNLEYIGINIELAQENVLSNIEFRQALSYAIDREEMLRVFKTNIGKPAINGVIPIGLASHTNELKGFSYNQSKARAIIESLEDEYEDLEFTISTNSDYIDIITYVAKAWENIGLEVNIELLESSVLRQQMRNGTIPLFRASWIADYPDEESFLCLFYGLNPAPPNYSRFKNEVFDALYNQAILENDLEKRTSLYREMDALVISNLPIIPLYYDETAIFTRKTIKSGLKTNALNLLDTRFLKM